MKKALLLLMAFMLLLLVSCDKANAEIDALKTEIESLKKQVEDAKLQEKASELLEKSKQEIEELKTQLTETKDKLEALLKEQKDKLTGTPQETPADPTGKAEDPVTQEEAMEILKPLGLRLEKMETPEYKRVVGNKHSQEGDVFFLYYALANTEAKALELFKERVEQEGEFTVVKDGDDDKVYTQERQGGEALLAVLDDHAVFLGIAKTLDQLKTIALSLGVDLD